MEVRTERDYEHTHSFPVSAFRKNVHDPQPKLRVSDAVAYYRRRIISIEEELDGFDQLDMEDEDGMERFADWGLLWYDNEISRRIFQLRKQYRCRQQHKINSLEEMYMLWQDIRNLEEKSGQSLSMGWRRCQI